MAPVQPRIGPAGDQHDERAAHKGDGGTAVDGECIDRHQRQRAHRDRPRSLQQGLAGQVQPVEGPLVGGDGHRGGDGIQRSCCGHSGVGRQPGGHTVLPCAQVEGSEDGERQHGVRAQQCKVVAQLDWYLPAMEREHQGWTDEPTEDQRARGSEEQPEHKGDLTDRDGLGLSSHLDVEHEQLDQPEHHRQGPPGNPRAVRGGSGGELGRPQRGRKTEKGGDHQQDAKRSRDQVKRLPAGGLSGRRRSLFWFVVRLAGAVGNHAISSAGQQGMLHRNDAPTARLASGSAGS